MVDNKVKPSYYFQHRTDDKTGGHKWKLKRKGNLKRSEGYQK